MKLTFLLLIIMSLTVLPNIASAEDRDNKKHHKRPAVHQHIKSKTNRITRKHVIYENGAILPQNRAARNKHRATRHKQKVRQAIASRNLKHKRDLRFSKRATYRAGTRLHKSPINGRILRFGGLSFIFSSGLYYQHLNNAYTVVRPPIGLKIRYLPNGFERLLIDGKHYYFFQGIYYIAVGAYYQVVEEPFSGTTSLSIIQANKEQQNSDFELGQRYSLLPKGAELVIVNEEQYFKYRDIYFLPQSSDSGVDYLAVKLD